MLRRLHKLARPAFMLFWASLLFFIATNIQVGWLYVVIAFFLVMIAISFAYPSRMTRKLAVSLAAPELMERGVPAAANLELRNGGRFSAFLVTAAPASGNFRADPAAATFTHVPGGGAARINLRMTPLKRGVFSAGDVLLRCGAPIGLYIAERKVRAAGEMVVHPRLLADAEVETELESRGLGAVRRDAHRFLTDPFFHQLREGKEAESAENIHWKLTAKRNSPVIKLRERRRAGAFTIVVDDAASHYGADEEFERVLERAVSVAKKLVEEDIPVVLRGLAAPPVAVETVGEWDAALRWSARIELAAPDDTRLGSLDRDLARSGEDTLIFNK